MKNKYLSIAEFAERAGVARQTVYNRITTDLGQFVKTIDNKKVISEAALEIFMSKESNPNMDSPLDKPLTAEERLISSLEREIEHYKSQLDLTIDKWEEDRARIADEQKKTAEAQEQAKIFHEQLLKLSNDFSELAKQSNTLLSQAHTIMALQAPKLEPAPKPEPEPEPKKKSLFGRFIKK